MLRLVDNFNNVDCWDRLADSRRVHDVHFLNLLCYLLVNERPTLGAVPGRRSLESVLDVQQRSKSATMATIIILAYIKIHSDHLKYGSHRNGA